MESCWGYALNEMEVKRNKNILKIKLAFLFFMFFEKCFIKYVIFVSVSKVGTYFTRRIDSFVLKIQHEVIDLISI